MFEPSPSSLHAAESHQDADRQHQDRDQCAADMQQEHDADQRDDDALLDQRLLQCRDGAIDEVRAVIDRNDRDAFGQARHQFRNALP